MKILATIFLASFCLMARSQNIGQYIASPGMAGDPGMVSDKIMLTCPQFKEPLRKVNGIFYNLKPLENWIKEGSLQNRRPLKDWIMFKNVTVISVTDDGILFGSERYQHFAKNYPGEAIDGKRVCFFAIKAGTYKYQTADNALATVDKYDCGEKLSTEEITELQHRLYGVKTNLISSNAPVNLTTNLVQPNR